MPEPTDRTLVFNGVNAASGGYLLPQLSAKTIAQIARNEPLDPKALAELKWRYQRASKVYLGVKAGVDSSKLSEAGWGVIFAHNASPAVQEALKPLLDRRKEQTGPYYQEYAGAKGYRPNESKLMFLARHGVGPGPADPEKVPYYLLIVGDPESIPYRFQYQLDVQYAVGRLSFDTPDEYANYARSVVAAETGHLALGRRVTFFAPSNDGDEATNLSATELVVPLAAADGGVAAKLERGIDPWEVKALIGAAATKSALGTVLGGPDTPAVLFTASHGVGFPNGDQLQVHRQGALLCQNWPGPAWGERPIPECHYYSRDDVTSDANPFGLIAFFFACYGAGTPRLDDFAHAAFKETRPALAPHAIVAGLPRRLLGHPKGGALAVVGHVDRAWGYSFQWDKAGRTLQTFEATLKLLLEGHPVGAALEFFNERYAELSTSLSDELEEIKYGKPPDDYALAGLWTATNDCRSYVVLGDPAVRVAVAGKGEAPKPRTPLTLTEPPALTAGTGAVGAATLRAAGFESAKPGPSGTGDGAGTVAATATTATDAVPDAALLSVVAATEQRFRRRASESPPPPSVSFAAGAPRILRVNRPDVVRKRLRRLGVPDAEIDAVLTSGRPSPSFAIIGPPGAPVARSAAQMGLERIMGRNDLIGVEFLASAVAAARSVARVLVKTGPTRLVGYGSGTMVSPRLFLTNHHVLPSAGLAASSAVEFGYEYARGGQLQTGCEVALDPEAFFLTDPALDFTLIAVKADAAGALADYGWLMLNDDEGAVLKDEYVNIVQHANGRPKQVALRDNQVTDILADFLHYRADTEPGSSGSPVFNDQWELVGLHHSGVPRRNDQGQILTRNSSVWTVDMGEAAIDWIANEGIRVGRILAYLKQVPLPGQQAKARDELLGAVISRPSVSSTRGPSEDRPMAVDSTRAEQAAAAAGSNGMTINVPIHVTISLNGTGTPAVSMSTPGATALPAAADAAGAAPETGEAISIDPNYDTRAGYDPSFLGTGSHTVPLPRLPDALLADAAKNRSAADGTDPHELPYHHFSVVLNRRRRLAFFTAVNIDGRSAKSPKRETDKWIYDPRVARDEQVGNELYSGNPFDRGHLVRRLDPAWGRSPSVVKTANDDTFHFSNCSPQHERFNQGKNLWAGLEDFLLNKASAEGKRLTVFTGPVFRDDDEQLSGVQIPREFWKVAVYAKPGAGLVSAAFVVTQEKVIESLTRPVGAEVSAEEVAMTFQVTLAEVEQLTRLDFGDLRKADVMTRGPGVSFNSGAPWPRVELTGVGRIKVE